MKMKFTNKGSEEKNCVYTGWSILQDHCLCNMQYKCTSKNVQRNVDNHVFTNY